MTVPGLYRDPALVARAAEGTGLKVMFATGYYTYDNLPFPFQYRGRGKILDDDDRTLESLFERDVTTVIGDTGFRAGVLKIVTDEPGMTPDVERLAIAVANVHARTGTPRCAVRPPPCNERRPGPVRQRSCKGTGAHRDAAGLSRCLRGGRRGLAGSAAAEGWSPAGPRPGSSAAPRRGPRPFPAGARAPNGTGGPR
jgi:hypothetical protein